MQNRMTKAGAALFTLWGVLHVWVGYEGLHQYLAAGPMGQWMLVVGGSAMPREAFQIASDPATLYAQGQLLVNFTMDVGASGLLGLFVGWMMWRRPGWLGFTLGAVVIGVVDMSFLTLLVLSGVVEFSLPVLAGPIIWFLAVGVSALGLISGNRAAQT